MSETTWSDGGSEGTAQGVLSLVLVLDAGRTGPACRQAGVERVLDALHQGLRAGWHGVIGAENKERLLRNVQRQPPRKILGLEGSWLTSTRRRGKKEPLHGVERVQPPGLA